jgi:transcriptional regulator NrdR family protein
MKCPVCKSPKNRVKDVRIYETFKHRYRQCVICGSEWQTTETIIPDTLVECNYEPLQQHFLFFKSKKKAD